MVAQPSEPLAPAAFDSVAQGYDAEFTETPLGRWLRDAVRSHLAPHLKPGQRVLELGCGTGEDAAWLVGQGARVTATDQSQRMLEMARQKLAARAPEADVQLAPLDMDDPSGFEKLAEGPAFDLVFSNFGPLNCAADRPRVGAGIARVLRPGGVLALVVMGPVCAWEMAWFASRGRFGQAFRRLRQSTTARLASGETLSVHYPSPRTLQRELGSGFTHLKTLGVGSLLPPSYLEPLTRKHARIFERLAGWDERLAPYAPFRSIADHYLLMMRRSG